MASTDRIQGYSGDLAIKTPCKVATTANTALAGLLTIDGVTLVAGDRVLVKDNTDTTTNGIYIAAAGTWNRAPDFDGVNDVIKGTQALVTDGTTNTNVFFTVSSATPTSIGSSAITFSASTSAAVSAVTAAAEADKAALSAAAAAGSVAAAAGSAAAAAIAAQITGTSATSLALTVGTKTFVTQTGEVWVQGHTATLARTGFAATTYMVGIVTAYNSGTGDMTVEVSRVVGTGGPYADWTLSLTVSDSVYSAQVATNSTNATNATHVTDADKGDIVIASGVWSIDTNAVTTAKILNANVTPEKLSQPFIGSTVYDLDTDTYLQVSPIPTWVKRITAIGVNISTNGTSRIIIQAGKSGSMANSTYYGGYGLVSSTPAVAYAAVDALGISLPGLPATDIRDFSIVFERINPTLWVFRGVAYGNSTADYVASLGGHVLMSETLDCIAITTAGGVSIFDPNSEFKVTYE